jgi:hypothetical protein
MTSFAIFGLAAIGAWLAINVGLLIALTAIKR